MRLILKVLVYAAAVWVAVQVVGGLEFDGDWIALLGIAVILGLVNAVIKPVVKILSLPAVVLTLGLFLLVINAVMFWLTIRISDGLDLGLTSEGAMATFLGAIVVSIVVWGAELVLGD